MIPVVHPDYGIKGIPKKPFLIEGILEIPLIPTYGFPIGGGYFRICPYWLTKVLIKKNKNLVFYIHPWELDPELPRYELPIIKKYRHYTGLVNAEKKFRKLLKYFKFYKMEEILKNFHR